MELGAWLRSIGLERYEARLRANAIDLEVLPNLTEAHLREIGLPLGARLKLLKAIDTFAPRAETISPTQNAAPTGAPASTAQRRQVTAMFSDLVGSTALSASMDPEDLGEVIAAYQKCVTDAAHGFDGFVAQYAGDGALVYFGYPRAHEDDAERAVRAGLELTAAVAALKIRVALQVRVGIATGLVVVGDRRDVGDPQELGIVGETPNLAARLQAIAEPNTVVITESTRRLIGGLFELEALGTKELKGIPRLVPAWVVRGIRSVESRFEAIRAGRADQFSKRDQIQSRRREGTHLTEGEADLIFDEPGNTTTYRTRQRPIRFRATQTKILSPLVGRHAELAFLQQCWRDAKEGDGQTVFISGVPGIGKSRIVYELKARLRRDPHFSVTTQCSPHCMQTALFPVIQLIQRLSGLRIGDSDGVKLEKIKRLIALATKHTDNIMPFVAEMMSIPIVSQYQALELTPKQIKAQLLGLLIELLVGLSIKRPILFVLEDIQWIDPSTQELVDLLASRMDGSRILLVVTHRPEYQARSHGNVRALAINRLKRRDAMEMARFTLEGRTLSGDVINKIIDKSDSIPLFVEELALGAIDSETTSHDSRKKPSMLPSVPESLRDSLVARLDRVPKARNVAQTAAVIGREFSYDMLFRIISLDHAELESSIKHLRQNDIIRLIENKPFTRYAFKHALVHDVAYDSLLKANRRDLHAKIATVIEKENPEIVTDRPELLAYHYSLAGNDTLAVQYWISGGHRARSRSANLEASAQYQKALESLRSLPDGPERSATELEIELSLGGCFIALDGYSSENTREAFESACKLSAELGDRRKELQAIFGLWGHFWMRAQHHRAKELGEMLLARADQLHDLMALIVGWRCLGSTLFTLGDFVGAREHLHRAVALGQQPISEASSLTYTVDPCIAAQLLLAWDLWILGYPEQALRNALQARSQATQRDDAYTAAFAYYVTSAVQLLRGETQASLASAEQSLALSREHHINLYALYSRFGRGCALAKLGQLEAAMAEIRGGIEEARRINLGYMRGFMLGWLATIQAERGEPEIALSTLDEALEQTNDVTGRAWEAELLRLRGDALLAARPEAAAEAERDYADALTVARKQSARSLELRAATSLARLLRAQGRNNEARAQLAPALGWFTEGFDTADLKEAKAVLDGWPTASGR
jgi:class 3 adenylate cyclase/predicted ATPase